MSDDFYPITFNIWELFWTLLPTLKSDVIYGRSLMQSSFSQNHEIPNSWQSYIVKRQEKETENSQIFWKKKRQDLVAANFHPHYHFFFNNLFVLCQAFFCSNNVWVLCIFFEAIKNWKIYPSLILTLPVSRCITYNHTFFSPCDTSFSCKRFTM